MKKCSDKECENEFIQYKSTDKYCSFKCYNKNRKVDLTLKSPISKSKKCKICKNNFTPKNIVTEPVCQNYECRLSYALKIVDKNKLEKEKEDKKIKNEVKKRQKDKLKTLSDWHSDLQKEINTIVRLIDKNHPCISSQRPLGKSYDAGHLYGRQSNPHIRYHLYNIWAQSVHDNQYKSGNQLEFIYGIEKTFGTQIKDYCLSLKGLPCLKLSIDQIKEFITKARQIVKHLRLDNREYTNFERLSLREEYNLYIGIYKDVFEFKK